MGSGVSCNVRIYGVDVLPEVAEQLSPGSPLTVVKKEGFLGKPWLQDQAFYESLQSSRTFQGSVFIVIASIFIAVWVRASIKLHSIPLGLGSLVFSLLCAFAAFRFLL